MLSKENGDGRKGNPKEQKRKEWKDCTRSKPRKSKNVQYKLVRTVRMKN